MPDVVKERYTAASVFDTVVTTALDGAPQRVIRTDVVDRIERSPEAAPLPAGRARRAAVPQGRPARRCGDLLARGPGHAQATRTSRWSQLAMAANAPMLIKATMVDGKPEVGILPTGQVTGVVDELPDRRRAARPDRGRGRGHPQAARRRLMDLTWSAEEDAFRAEARAWLEANLAAWRDGSVASRSGRHPRGLRPAPRLGAAPLRRPVGGGVVGARARRPRRLAVGVAPLRGGVLPGRRPAPDHPERHLPAGPERSTSSARPSSSDGILPPHGRRRGPLVPGLVGAERRQRPGLGHQQGPAGRRRLGARRPEDLDHPGRVLHAPVRPVPHRPRAAPGTRASPTCSSRSTRRASPCAASAGSTATRASPRCSSTRRSCADDAVPGGVVLGEPEGGWARRHGHRRLRARPHAALARAASSPPPSGSSPSSGERGDAALRRRAATAWMQAEAYQLQTLQTVTKLAAGAKAGRRGEPHEAVVVRARRRAARDRPRPARPRRRARGPVEQGLAVLAVRPDLRGHQRDPAQHRRRAPPGAARVPMRFGLTDDQLAFRDAVRDLLAKECPPAVVRAAWEAPAGELDRGVWAASTRWACLGCSCPRTTAASGSTRPSSCRSSRRPAGSPSPTRSSRPRWWPPRSCGTGLGMVATDLGGPNVAVRGRRRRAPPATPARASCSPAPTSSTVTPVATVDGGRRAGTGRPPVPASSSSRRPRRRRARLRPRARSARPPCSSGSARRCSTSPSATSPSASSSACRSAASRR